MAQRTAQSRFKEIWKELHREIRGYCKEMRVILRKSLAEEELKKIIDNFVSIEAAEDQSWDAIGNLITSSDSNYQSLDYY